MYFCHPCSEAEEFILVAVYVAENLVGRGITANLTPKNEVFIYFMQSAVTGQMISKTHASYSTLIDLTSVPEGQDWTLNDDRTWVKT